MQLYASRSARSFTAIASQLSAAARVPFLMKQIPKLLILLFVSASTLSAAPEDRTAKAIKAKAETFAGQQVSVEITHVACARNASNEECSIFVAHTFDTGEDIPAGSILVAVNKEKHDSFVDKFGATPDVGAKRAVRNRETKRLTGTLRMTSKKVPYIDLSDGAATEAHLNMADGEAEQPGGAGLRENLRRKFKGLGGRGGPARN